MAQNIVVSLFPVESEGYQALTELKQNPGGESSYVSAAALVKKENGTFRTLDGFDTGSQTMDDMAIGGLVGALFGILGGPIGILLGGSYGALIGSAFDTDDALMGASMLEQIADKMVDGEVAVVCLACEENEDVLDARLEKFKPTIARFDASAVAAEVEEAQMLEKEMELKDAKIQALESQAKAEQLFVEAMNAMKRYSGYGDGDDNASPG